MASLRAWHSASLCLSLLVFLFERLKTILARHGQGHVAACALPLLVVPIRHARLHAFLERRTPHMEVVHGLILALKSGLELADKTFF